MAERAFISELVQIAPEVTEGVGLPATKRLQSMMWDLTPNVGVKPLRGSGYKHPSVAPLGKEWATGKISGDATYTEIVYLLSSLLKKVTPVPGGATSKVWTFDPSPTAIETIQPFSLESGSTVRAERSVGMVVDSLGMNFTRDAVTVTGSSIGRAIEDPFTITTLTSAAELAIIPILPSQVSVFLDATYAGAGTTKLLRCLEVDWSYGGLWGPFWALNAAVAGQSATVELPPTCTAKLVMEADAAGMGPLTNLRAGSSTYLRIDATGTLIEASHPYHLAITSALKVTNFAFGNRDGVRTAEWTFVMVNDSTAGKATDVVVENLLSTL